MKYSEMNKREKKDVMISIGLLVALVVIAVIIIWRRLG
jgi:predicted nucleic acid-binding Zn ribbon protein